MATVVACQASLDKGIKRKVELKRFNIEEELSSIRFSCADEAIGEIKNLFFQDQLTEEQILVEIYSPNNHEITDVNMNRLNIDRVFSKKQISNKYFFSRGKLVDSVKFQEDYSIRTILEVKNEQRRLETEFKGFFVLMPGNKFYAIDSEPLLFAQVGPNVYYLLNDYLLDEDRAPRFKFKNIFSWIKKRISSKTSSRS
ncbi:MAG: hypothetical protein ACI8ZM_000244 [Crocinitomix sp.]